MLGDGGGGGGGGDVGGGTGIVQTNKDKTTLENEERSSIRPSTLTIHITTMYLGLSVVITYLNLSIGQ